MAKKAPLDVEDATTEGKQSTVKIRMAKIKDDLFLEGSITEELPGHSKKDSKFTCTVPIHEDLKKAMAKLNKHLAILCDGYKFPSKEKSIDQWEPSGLEDYTVKSFTIGGNDENEGVTISGSKDGTYGLINLNSPFQKWASKDYGFISSLASDVEECIYEVEEYLFHGKKAPERQLEMFDAELEEVEHAD